MTLRTRDDTIKLVDSARSFHGHLWRFRSQTHLSSLLDRVARGEEVVITKRGKPVARLVPFAKEPPRDLDQVIARLKELRKETTLGSLSWKELRDEGRKY